MQLASRRAGRVGRVHCRTVWPSRVPAQRTIACSGRHELPSDAGSLGCVASGYLRTADMTYCLGIVTQARPGDGLGLAHQRRATTRSTSAARCTPSCSPGERVFVLLTSGSLSLHAVGHDAAAARLRRRARAWRRRRRMYDAARVVGEQVRAVSEPRPRGAGARRVQVQRPPPPRRAGRRADARALPDLPAGQPAPGDGGLAVPPDRRDASTAGRSSTAASASTARRWRRRRSTRCCRSTRR